MSNVKSIMICGEVPFNIYEHDDTKGIWAFFSAPSSGLQINYGRERNVPNSSLPNNDAPANGQTAMYGFTMHGTEAVSWGWLDNFVQKVTKYGGTISVNQCRDLEG